jgi:hypothetical protein
MQQVVTKSDPILSAELTRKQAALLLCIHPSFFSKLEKSNVLKCNASGKFPLTDLWRQWFDHISNTRTSAKNEAQARLTKLKIDKLEREELIAQRDWFSAAQVQRVMLEVIAPLKSGLIGIGARVTRDRSMKKKIDDIIADEINRAVAKVRGVEEFAE